MRNRSRLGLGIFIVLTLVFGIISLWTQTASFIFGWLLADLLWEGAMKWRARRARRA